jgi:pimeloyl-ACP methyl ester carboxylesterase
MTFGLQRFRTFDGILLAYQAWGDGPEVILLHGFMVDGRINWVDAGLIEPLVAEGRRVIALDARGHGRSDKPHDPRAYAKRAMARDVVALIDSLGATGAVLIGYSMGGYTALEAAMLDARVSAVAACGVGIESDEDHKANSEITRELTAETAPSDSFYRDFADRVGADRFAMAARLQGAVLPQIRPEDAARIDVPTHIINGADDVHDATRLAALCPRATAVTVQGDHISAVRDPSFRNALLTFLRACPG